MGRGASAMVVLDTDHLSLLQWNVGTEGRRLAKRLAVIPADEIVTTIINFEEQMRGWLSYLGKARTVTQQIDAYSRLTRHLEYYRQIPVLSFDETAAVEFQHLRLQHRRVGTMDLKIAAIVLSTGATLLSRNLSDFGRIEGLKTEDWTL
jgi:tRNA(fMet)-specific endonuclease VapC